MDKEQTLLIKSINNLFPETTEMSMEEIVLHLNQMAMLKQSLHRERGINEVFRHVVNSNINPRM